VAVQLGGDQAERGAAHLAVTAGVGVGVGHGFSLVGLDMMRSLSSSVWGGVASTRRLPAGSARRVVDLP
jgi:hypothetical protein